MKVYWITGVIVLLLAALTLSANRIAARAVAAELPKALTSALGQQVTVSNVSTSLWQLRARAQSLTLGDPKQPSMAFSDVSIELNLQELLSGRIKLEEASSAQTDVYLGRLPARQSSDPVDLSNVERWVPESVQMALLQIHAAEEVSYSAADIKLEVLGPTARRISWRANRQESELQFQISTQDISPIYAGKGAKLQFQVLEPAKRKSEPLLSGNLSSDPADGGGFNTRMDLESPAFKGDWSFHSESLFAMPGSSRLQLQSLMPDKLSGLAVLFAEQPVAAAADTAAPAAVAGKADFLQRLLPTPGLPDHKLDLSVAEVVLDDEKIKNLSASVVLKAAASEQAASIDVSELTAELPLSDLKGSIAVVLAKEWSAQVIADIETRSREPEQLRGFESNDWLWKTGKTNLISHGSTLTELIDNARGDVDITGAFKASAELPIALKVHLDDSRGRIGADQIDFLIGSSAVSGSVWLDEDRKNLLIRLHAASFDVTELLPTVESTASSEPGFAVPEYNWWDSQLTLDVRLTSDTVQLSGVALTGFDTSLTRGPGGERLDVSFSSNRAGRLHAQVHTVKKGDLHDLDMNLQLTDLAARAVAVDMAATMSGGVRVQSSGKTILEMINGLSSRINATADFDRTEGNLQVTGNPQLLVQGNRIVGFSFANLKIIGDNQPAVSGKFSYDARTPLFSGDLSSQGFDADRFMAVLPAPEHSDTAPDLDDILKRLPPLDLKLKTQSLTLLENTLHGFSVELTSRPDELKLDPLQFRSELGDLQATGFISTKAENVEMEMDGNFGGVVISSLLKQQQLPQFSNPVHGTVQLRTSGADWQALTSNIRGQVKLETAATASAAEQLNVDLVVQQQGKGFLARLNEMQYGTSDLQGEVGFEPGKVPSVHLDLKSSYLDTRPWQKLLEEEMQPLDEKIKAGADTGKDSTSIFHLVENSFGVLKDMVRSPLRLFGFGTHTDSDKYFSDKPFPVATLAAFNADVKLDMADLVTTAGVAKGSRLTGNINNGKIEIKLDADSLNGGPSDLTVIFDSQAKPPTVRLLGDVRGYMPDNDPKMSARSAFIDLTSQGNSEAELAAAMNGELYAESGPGQSDMADFSMGFLTTSLLHSVIKTLVPDRNKVPMLQCAIAYASVTDGVIVTPKGVVLQAAEATILARAEINLKKEKLAVQFDSRSRTGVGISVGNMFSNTVRLSGTLQKPSLVPNTTGIVWRGWAALATGGLSLLGESFIKRVLASDNACKHVRKDIAKLVCSGSTPMAKSTLVCPAA